MSFLLDTNVVSEIRRRAPDANVMAWFASVPAHELFLSVLVVGEIRQGIERLRRRDPQRAAAFDPWLDQLLAVYGDRLVPVSTDIADLWGRLNAVKPVPVVDGLLAATALVRGWVFVTRNTGDVARTGVRLLDPFQHRR